VRAFRTSRFIGSLKFMTTSCRDLGKIQMGCIPETLPRENRRVHLELSKEQGRVPKEQLKIARRFTACG
jgi:hypothetical protein